MVLSEPTEQEKSTFLRLAAGILKADEGHVTIDGEEVFVKHKSKEKGFSIYRTMLTFFSNASPLDMMEYYSVVYERFDKARFHKLMGNFGLDEKRKIHTFSKGMKKQVSVILGICSNTDYLFCDETFDGLDPVMRQAVKSIFAAEIEDRNMTPVIASHNLRELEDICDHVGLLHKGGILLSKDLDDMKLNIHKIQCVLKEGMTADDLKGLQILSQEGRGRLLTLTVRGTKQEAEDIMNRYEPVFFECIPLSLEEIFISETEVAGYDIRKLIFLKLQKEDLKRRIWVIALLFLGFFFAYPVNLALIMENAANSQFAMYNGYTPLVDTGTPEYLAKVLEYKTKAVVVWFPMEMLCHYFLMVTAAVVIGAAGFVYLHNQKKVDFLPQPSCKKGNVVSGISCRWYPHTGSHLSYPSF